MRLRCPESQLKESLDVNTRSCVGLVVLEKCMVAQLMLDVHPFPAHGGLEWPCFFKLVTFLNFHFIAAKGHLLLLYFRKIYSMPQALHAKSIYMKHYESLLNLN